ncbi:MAG: putative aminohydrolase SsnA [Anaerolineales bacterium]|jgi:putative selenium metabolism protein SsnA
MLITNARVVTWEKPNRILDDHAVCIEGDRITAVGPNKELIERYPHMERLDAGGQLLMPGNICAHTHFYSALARGMAIPGRPPRDFPDVLRKLWWPLDKSLHEEDVYISAMVSLVDAVKHGTTTLIDHHASPNAIHGSLDQIAAAVEASGLRAVLCYEVTDRDGQEKAQAGIAENVRFLERCDSGEVAEARVQATFGLHASLTLSDETLDECRSRAPDGTGFHIHVAEHEADEYDSLQKSGLRVTDRLHRHGILGPRTIVAHAIHIDAMEVDLLKESGTWVTHQPRSNMNNGVGVAEVESMLRAGVPVALGNDGFSNAMWEEWKTAYLLHKVWHRDPRRMPGDLLAEIAVGNSARLAGIFFPQAPLGVIAAGAYADLILVDYHPTTPLSGENLPWHIVFGFHDSMVTGTMVAGKLLMKDRELLFLDEEQIAARARELAPGVWERYRSFVPAD